MCDPWGIELHGPGSLQAGYLEGSAIILLLEGGYFFPYLGDLLRFLNIAHPGERDLLWIPEL